jgi:uncharacterized protein DUF1501
MISRRDALRGGLLGAGMIGLRAMATGLPISFLLNPSIARSDEACAAMTNAQFLILSMSASGDALNCNVPGTYDLPATFAAGTINHPDTPEMAPTALKLGKATFTAAAPWAGLPQNVLDRTSFFHHRTQTANHGELGKVLKLFGQLRRGEEIVSYYSKNLSQCFKTVQPQPVTIGGETASYGGRYLPNLSPTGLKAILTGPSGITKDLQVLRDQSLDKLNALFKQNRAETTAERAFLDSMALSQTQIRDLIAQVADELQSIKGDDAANQVTAAVLLVKMNVTPVVTLHLPFSGDNHTDALWKNETAQTVSSVANIKLLTDKLKSYNLQDKVTFATMNVFGRKFDTILGRGHNAQHSISVMIGKGIKPGVIGGLVPGGNSADIDSVTGAISVGGDIPAADSLASVAKTLGRALGISQASLDDQITAGKTVAAALV